MALNLVINTALLMMFGIFVVLREKIDVKSLAARLRTKMKIGK
jgi:hypothetical protein